MPEQPPSYASGTLLGEAVDYRSSYNPGLLQPIARTDYRKTLVAVEAPALLEQGVDHWCCYELSWLDSNGKPEVAVLEIDVPASSPRIVESKSLKLYLNSLNQQAFGSLEALLAALQKDLGACLGAEPALRLKPVGPMPEPAGEEDYELIDAVGANCEHYQRKPELLQLTGQQVQGERLVSHLFRSQCPVTGQPDWATIKISYSGPQLERVSLLKYIVSYRDHEGFHEQCIEQLITDIQKLGKFSALQVAGQFTRRGGIDICPVRGVLDNSMPIARVNRQ